MISTVDFNESMKWMKSYIAHASSWKLFRSLSIEGDLARPVMIQISNNSSNIVEVKTFAIQFSQIVTYWHVGEGVECAL